MSRIRAGLLKVVVFATLSSSLWPSTALAAPDPAATDGLAGPAATEFTISGRITVSGTTAGVETFDIQACDPADPIDCITVASEFESTGYYTTDPLSPGSYLLQVAYVDDSRYVDIYDGWYSDSSTGHYTFTSSGASPVVITSANRTGVNIALGRDRNVTGRITAAGTTTGIADATVTADCDPYEVWCYGGTDAITDANGYYTLELLPPGYYTVEITAPVDNPLNVVGGWYTDATAGNYAPSVELARPVTMSGAANRTGLNVALPRPRSISGRITVAGSSTSVVGATVQVCNPFETTYCDVVAEGVSGATGQYSTTPIPPGSYLLEITAPDPNPLNVFGGWYTDATAGHYAATRGAATLVAVGSTDRTGVDVALDFGRTISGRVTVQGSGTGVADAYVAVCDPAEPDYCSEVAWAMTGARGEYTTGTVPAGSYLVRIYAPDPNPAHVFGGWYAAAATGGWAATRQGASQVVVDASSRTGIDVSLPVGGVVKGRITATDGTGVRDAEVAVCPRQASCTYAYTGPDGSYETAPLIDGAYRVRVDPPYGHSRGLRGGYYDPTSPGNWTASYVRAARIVIGGFDATTVSLTLPSGPRISGRITAAASGSPVEDVEVTVCRAETLDRCAWVDAAYTNAAGEYTTGVLPPGAYRLQLGAPYWSNPLNVAGGYYASGTTGSYVPTLAASTSIVVGESDARGIDVALPTGLTIRGRITAAGSGTGVSQVIVNACDAAVSYGCSYVGVTTTDSNGGYAIGGLTADSSYRIRVGTPWSNPLQVIGGYYASGTTGSYAAKFAGSSIVAVGAVDVEGIDVTLPVGRTIGGRIVAAGSGAAVVDADVYVCDPTVTYYCSVLASDRTDEFGDYTTGLVTSGAYRISIGMPYVNPLQVLGGYYASGTTGSYAATWTGATSVAVGSIAVVGINVTLPVGRTISGRITAAGSGTGVADTEIGICDPSVTDLCDVIESVYTDESGDYTTGALPSGSYRLRIFAPWSNALGVLGGFYASGTTGSYAASFGGSSALALTAANLVGIDVTLPLSPRISGRITASGSGVRGADIGACDVLSGTCRWATTDANGDFSLALPRTGSYTVRVNAPFGSALADGWYRSAVSGFFTLDQNQATAIPVSVSGTQIAVDLPSDAPYRGIPVISLQPSDVATEADTYATFRAAASGTPNPVVWWEESSDGLEWREISGEWEGIGYGEYSLSLDVYAYDERDGYFYRAAFANAYGVVYTRAARLTLAPANSFPLTVARSGSGSGTVTSTPGGIDCGSTCTWSFENGTSVTLSATAAPGSVFAGWSGGSCSGTSTCIVTGSDNQPVTVTATFANSSSLAVARSGSGSGAVTSLDGRLACGSTCVVDYSAGTPVSLVATPSTGSRFAGWAGACSGTSPTCDLVTGAGLTTVTATFTAYYTATIVKAGAGTGTVASDDGSILCGPSCSATSGDYSTGSLVTLTATAAPGAVFQGWSAPCSGTGACVLTLSQSRSVTATFARSFTLTVNRTGSGTVSSGDGRVSCGVTCTAEYSEGSSVTLTATPQPGSRFEGWSGPCSGVGTCTVLMSTARTVTATFVQLVRVTIQKSGSGSGSVSSRDGSVTCGIGCVELTVDVTQGSTLTLSAIPRDPTTGTRHTFDGWSGGGCAGTGTCELVVASAVTVVATFTRYLQLSVTKTGLGQGSVTSGDGRVDCGDTCPSTNIDYSSGSLVTLRATPAPGSTFAGWSGDCQDTGVCVLVMSAPRTVSARFETAVPTETTTGTADPLSGFVEGSAGSRLASASLRFVGRTDGTRYTITFAQGSNPTPGDTPFSPDDGLVFVDIDASASDGSAIGGAYTVCFAIPVGMPSPTIWHYTVAGWVEVTTSASDGRICGRVTSLSPFVVATPRTRSLTVTPAGAGAVTSSPPGISCPASCSAEFTTGIVVTLTATPASGSTFSGWAGACSGTSPTCAVTMSEARSVTASFAGSPPPSPSPAPAPPAPSGDAITRQPANQVGLVGLPVTFSVSTGDGSATFAWERSSNGTTWTAIAGATGRTLTFKAAAGDQGARFRAIVTVGGVPTTSAVATLTIATLTKANVTSGKAGATVALTGRGLSGATRVTFGGVKALRITPADNTTIWISVPAGAKTGKLVVYVGGGSLSLAKFTVLAGKAAPRITSISTSSAKVGATVTITGVNLIGTTTLKIGAVGASYKVLSPTKITFTVPAAATSGKVTVITAGGSATSTATFTRTL